MLKNVFEGFDVQEDVPLAPLTTWRVGGAARFFYEPTPESYSQILSRAYENGIPVYYLGRGSNVLIADEGIDGLVVCTKRSFRALRRNGDYVEAESGVPLPALSRFAAKHGFTGYEFLIGIPGTVGGGIVINAGLTSQGIAEMSEILIDVEVLDNSGRLIRIPRQELCLGYRTSCLLDRGVFVVRARFHLGSRGDSEEIRKKMAKHLAERRRKQPLSKWTAGSTFKQPDGGHPAGWYIERAGLKGLRIGGAVVSEKHANWIENVGAATALDIRNLIEHVQKRVLQELGVSLEREVRYLPGDQEQRATQRSGYASPTW